MIAAILGELLRDPTAAIQRCRTNPSRHFVLVLLLALLAGAALFGAVVGSFRGGVQTAFSALKLPLATLLTPNLPEAAALLAGMNASLDAELIRFGYVVPAYADPEPGVAAAP